MMPGSYGSAVQILGVVNQLVRRNSPDKAKIMCLEDVMESEEAFVDIWVRAFQLLGLPIDAQPDGALRQGVLRKQSCVEPRIEAHD